MKVHAEHPPAELQSSSSASPFTSLRNSRARADGNPKQLPAPGAAGEVPKDKQQAQKGNELAKKRHFNLLRRKQNEEFNKWIR